MPGILGELVKILGTESLAGILTCPPDHLTPLAQNKRAPEPHQAQALEYLCLLNGIRPGLYVYSEWKDPQGIVVMNPGGWTATSLKNPRWGSAAPHWSGNPLRELKPADAETLSEAREKGWPW